MWPAQLVRPGGCKETPEVFWNGHSITHQPSHKCHITPPLSFPGFLVVNHPDGQIFQHTPWPNSTTRLWVWAPGPKRPDTALCQNPKLPAAWAAWAFQGLGLGWGAWEEGDLQQLPSLTFCENFQHCFHLPISCLCHVIFLVPYSPSSLALLHLGPLHLTKPKILWSAWLLIVCASNAWSKKFHHKLLKKCHCLATHSPTMWSGTDVSNQHPEKVHTIRKALLEG